MKGNIMQKIHDLKIWPQYFQDVQSLIKPFEYRNDDRDFKVGDILNLREYDQHHTQYTGRVVQREISYKLDGGAFELPAHKCILGFTDRHLVKEVQRLRERVAYLETIQGGVHA